MARIALIACTSLKRGFACQAHELYSASPRFRYAYCYASGVVDRIYILSAKHGLIFPDDVIAPYDESLVHQGVAQRKAWAARVLFKLGAITDLSRDEFLVLAGKKYYEFLTPRLARHEIPLAGLSQGQGLARLKQLAEEVRRR